MIIKNGFVYRTDKFVKEDLYIKDNKISAEVWSEDDVVIDAEGKYVIPGLVDVHFHGCAGYDFCDGTMEAIEKIAEYELSSGITTIVPASMTLSTEMLKQIFGTAAEYAKNQDVLWNADKDAAAKRAYFAGIHMEGPYVSAKKKGAQNGEFLHKAELDHFRMLNALSGNNIKIVSLAPEEEGALDFIKAVAGETVISVAHTTADYDIAHEAFEAGADHVTHTYNAMPPFTHRAPGVIGAAFDKPTAMMELISDGIHIHPAAIRATCSMFGNSRMVFISDSMMGTGLEDGQYQLGGQGVTKVGSLATLADGTIAGSVTNLYDCMCNAVSFGIPMVNAVRFASENAAKSAGLGSEYGTLNAGAFADVLIIDDNMKLEQIIHRGVKL